MADVSYSPAFFAAQRDGAARSAAVVMPLVLEMVQPSSVVDLGCGVGAWLEIVRTLGVTDILGIDGAYVRTEDLRIPASAFRAGDLTQPISLGRGYDLAMSLEVGEHLPANRAATLVASLVAAAPVVLFSAAVPKQGGTHHVNEQWPAYWASLFATHGYRCLDCLRSRIWNEPGIDAWYAQNVLLFAHDEALQRMTYDPRDLTDAPLPLVHPRLYVKRVEHLECPPLRQYAQMAVPIVRRAVEQRIGR